MPIEVGIWRLGNKVEQINFESMPTEKQLEDILAGNISILDPNLLLIGRQVSTAYGKYIDLLAMNASGELIVIELKRDETPREVVAQLLDYGSWVRELEDEDIAEIFANYLQKHYPEQAMTSLDSAFCDRFGVKKMPESLNSGHELVVVASELDDSTERIVGYLADEYGVAINAMYFRFFKDNGNEYLSRVWLIDPDEADKKVTKAREVGSWNGEFYVSFGEEETRHWSDAREHGYIAAGGGAWYSKALYRLEMGKRIWVKVPGHGYVGVGYVRSEPKPITEFSLKNVPITKILESLPPTAGISADKLEYYVLVEWLKTVPLDEAVNERGLFGNRNIVVQPKKPEWIHTLNRLKKLWQLDE